MRWIASLLISLLTASLASAEPVTVSAAISLKDSLEAIAKTYESQTGDRITFNFDASGKLAQQIRQGAPVDVFISADDEQVDSLVKSGDAEPVSRRLVVRNALVLIAPASSEHPPKEFADLVNIQGKIAIGDPRSVPAGRYSEQTLRSLKIYDAVAARFVLAENVRQVLTYVQRGEVDAGMVYATDAKAAGNRVKVIAVADPAAHDLIEYPAVVVTHASHTAAAARFLDYLKTEPARAVFLKFGFVLPEAATATTRPVK
jgi:molybdate transport system substrate-binding protein